MEKLYSIKSFEGKYSITKSGKVFSHPKGFKGHKNGMWMKIMIDKKGSVNYPYVRLFKNKKNHKRFIHRLLAYIFIPNPKNKREVNHIDGNKLNYSLNNLEWVTHKENIQHAVKFNLIKYDYKKLKKNAFKMGISNRKITLDEVNDIKRKYKTGFYTQEELSKEYPISRQSISNILRGISYKI